MDPFEGAIFELEFPFAMVSAAGVEIWTVRPMGRSQDAQGTGPDPESLDQFLLHSRGVGPPDEPGRPRDVLDADGLPGFQGRDHLSVADRYRDMPVSRVPPRR